MAFLGFFQWENACLFVSWMALINGEIQDEINKVYLVLL